MHDIESSMIWKAWNYAESTVQQAVKGRMFLV